MSIKTLPLSKHCIKVAVATDQVQWASSYLFGKPAARILHEIGTRQNEETCGRAWALSKRLRKALTELKDVIEGALPVPITRPRMRNTLRTAWGPKLRQYHHGNRWPGHQREWIYHQSPRAMVVE